MNNIFDALADPTRRRLLDLLSTRDRSVGELVLALGISQPAVSKQLKLLKSVGLVGVRKDAQRRWYYLCPAPLALVDAWLAPYREFWLQRLDALERHLDKES